MSALLISIAVLAQAPAQLSAATPWNWSDGHAPHQAWLDVQTLAEVQPSAEGATALQALDPAAKRDSASPRVALWLLSTNDAARLLPLLEAKLPGHFAPVFHDQASTASKLRVPAGGVMIWLDPSADVGRFVEQHGLVLEQSFGKGTLLVAAAPGAASLALTQALRADPAVKTVMPNWWFRAHKR